MTTRLWPRTWAISSVRRLADPMANAELGVYGGVARRAFKLKGEDVKVGDPVTAAMLEGLSPRHLKSLGNAGYVTYYNQAASGQPAQKPTKPKAGRKQRK